MKIAIMQPYLFPYIGYWQLIKSVDTFVILDDVNFIMRGYINRNEILLNGKRYRFSIPIKKASQNKLIMDIKMDFSQKEKEDFLKTIKFAYRRAPYFDIVMPIIRECVKFQEENLTKYILNSIYRILNYLNIDKRICISSELNKSKNLKAESRILEICKIMKADIYINPCGGRNLYHYDVFEKEGIQLFFLDPSMEKIKYYQNQDSFVEYLSIIDVLMFNSKEKIEEFLGEYSLNEK